MKKIITIIGCGAVGTAQLYHLVHQLINDQIEEYFEIIIFEKSSNVGHGLAFMQDDETNLLNRNAETMSLIHHKQDSFYDWLSRNKKKNKNNTNKKDVYLPRSVFGLYCEDVFHQTLLYARKYRLKISIIHDEVTDICKHHEEYRVETKNKWSFLSHIIILTVGNLPSNKFGNYQNNTKFYSTPYPTKKLQKIPTGASVGIIGSRLSAIDAAIALKQNGHTGSIGFITRSGRLPCVKAPYLHHKLSVLTLPLVKNHLNEKGELSLIQVIKWLIKEVRLAIPEERISLSEWLKSLSDPKKHLQNEFKVYHSKERIVWQAVMIALNDIIEDLWEMLHEKDKELFHNIYKSRWMSCRVGMPIKNARKIYNLIITRQLSVIKNFKSLTIQNDLFQVNTDKKTFKFDYMINATGNCDDLRYISSSLIDNMKSRGLINLHKFGGVQVDFESSKIISSNNIIENNLYAVGSLTSGTYLFTSVLELNVKHTAKIAHAISSDFIASYRLMNKDVHLNRYYISKNYQETLTLSEGRI